MSEQKGSASIGKVKVLAGSSTVCRILDGGGSGPSPMETAVVLSAHETRGLSPKRGERYGQYVIRDDVLSWAGPRGCWIEMSPVESLMDTDNIRIAYDPGVPVTWLVESLIEPLCFMVNLRHGIVFSHASAFKTADKSAMVAGWTRIGKTEILLQLLEKGATFIADDWVGLGEGKMWPYLRMVKLSTFNLSRRMGLLPKVLRVEGSTYVGISDLAISTTDPTEPSFVFHVERFNGRGIDISPACPDIVIRKMVATLAYAVVHYLGGIVAACQSAGSTGIDKELSQFVWERAEPVLTRDLGRCIFLGVACGHESGPELITSIDGTVRGHNP